MSKILHRHGYVIYRGLVDSFPDDILASLRRRANDKAEPIFNNVAANDNRRKQLDLPLCNPKIKEWIDSVEYVLRDTHPLQHLAFRNWVALQSLPGCKSQQPHSDYVPNAEFLEKMSEWESGVQDIEKMPLLCLVAIMPNTYLDIWENTVGLIAKSEDELAYCASVYPKITRVKLCLQAGDVLFFRPDLIHAGSQFEEENLRLHVYLDSPSIHRIPNKTYIINRHGGYWLRSLVPM